MRKLFYGVALAALATSAASAQSTKPAGGETAVTEVIVTARRKEERVQDVPAAVTGLSAETIQEQGGVKDIKDLSYLLPGLAFVDTGNINAENNIRGAGAGTARTAGVSSPIAVLRDGASITGGNIGGRTYTRGDLFDLARVEVTRGPQGALYGVNAVGGVLQAISQRPRDEFGYSLAGAYSRDIERLSVDGILNLPITDNLGVRLGFQRVNKDKGFFYNTYLRRYGDVEEYDGLKLGIEWAPTDSLTIFSVFDYNEEVSPSNLLKSVNVANDPTTPPAQVGPADIDGPFVFAANSRTDVDRLTKNFTTIIDWDTALGRVTSISALRQRTTVFRSDADGSAPGYATPPFPAATCATRLCTNNFLDDSEFASQELRLASQSEGPLSWMVGATIQAVESDFATIIDGRTISAANVNPSGIINASSVAKEEEVQTGVFGTVSWEVTDALTLDGAVRWNRSEKKSDAYSVRRQPSAALSCVNVYRDPFKVFSINPACALSRNLTEESFENTSPAISGRYEILPNWRVFGSVAIGYRSGGFNANSVNDPAIPAAYTPEKNLAYEVGTKFELGGALFTVTAFQNNFDDLLVTVSSIGPDLVTRNYRFSAGQATTEGVDAELFGRTILPEGWGRLNYSLAVNYLTGEIDSGPYQGRTVEGSPEWTYIATAGWRKPLVAGWSMLASLNYRAQRGGFTNTVQINNQVELPDLDLWNGSIGVQNENWRLTVDARNLTDEVYETLRDPTRSVYGDPREVRLTLSYAFGSEAR